ncbi:MAG: GTPase HflX [Bdellovibrionaceae bacterium]|nr:GTPase HflX [Pseudobdellovibrionaceae bacterium]
MSAELKNAVLVGIQLPKISPLELQASLDELTRLVTTLGYKVVGQVTQKRSSDRSASILGEGKLRELAQWTNGRGFIAPTVDRKLSKAAEKWKSAADMTKNTLLDATTEVTANTTSDTISETIANTMDDQETQNDQTKSISKDVTENADGADDHEGTLALDQHGSAQIVIVDTDLSPSQIRNLENATGVTVLDRTGVIIEIFSRHARTRAARLQVEIARLTYVAPRLRETGGGGDRQGGGVGGKGAGESALELDKRKIRDRIKELKTELASIGNEHHVRRARRQQETSVALVGYTNAGKSSLMRAMTGSEVLVADKLFATLDTTIRPLYPETRPKVLLSDTVGFIKKLPHDLVASFKSTLDEALNASLLLYVVDSSDPAFRSQLEVTQTVLADVGAAPIQSLLVLNKRDRLNQEQMQSLQAEFPEAIMISTRDPNDLKTLRDKIMSYFESDMVDEDLFIPYIAKGIIGDVRSKMKVLAENYDEKGVLLKVRSHAEAIAQIRKKLEKKN